MRGSSLRTGSLENAACVCRGGPSPFQRKFECVIGRFVARTSGLAGSSAAAAAAACTIKALGHNPQIRGAGATGRVAQRERLRAL